MFYRALVSSQASQSVIRSPKWLIPCRPFAQGEPVHQAALGELIDTEHDVALPYHAPAGAVLDILLHQFEPEDVAAPGHRRIKIRHGQIEVVYVPEFPGATFRDRRGRDFPRPTFVTGNSQPCWGCRPVIA